MLGINPLGCCYPQISVLICQQNMNIPRGYQSQATTSAGNIFIIGASWSGGQGGKNGELYNPGANTYNLLSGAPVAPMLTADAQGKTKIALLLSAAHKLTFPQVYTELTITAGYSDGRTTMFSRPAPPSL